MLVELAKAAYKHNSRQVAFNIKEVDVGVLGQLGVHHVRSRYRGIWRLESAESRAYSLLRSTSSSTSINQ